MESLHLFYFSAYFDMKYGAEGANASKRYSPSCTVLLQISMAQSPKFLMLLRLRERSSYLQDCGQEVEIKTL